MRTIERSNKLNANAYTGEQIKEIQDLNEEIEEAAEKVIFKLAATGDVPFEYSESDSTLHDRIQGSKETAHELKLHPILSQVVAWKTLKEVMERNGSRLKAKVTHTGGMKREEDGSND